MLGIKKQQQCIMIRTFGTKIRARKTVVNVNIPSASIPVPILM